MAAEGEALREVTAITKNVEDHTGYFSSYADLKVHEVMLRDWPRNKAYRRFFEENADLVRGKVVMDVGAGTGILSLFAASVGARKVYAVEASNTALLCKEIVKQNGFADKVEVLHSAVEDVTLEGGCKVDVIVSEWMGFYLLHESMLDSVIVARDKFLAADGIMVPSVARLYLAPVCMEQYLEEKLEFWGNVCGFDFSPAIPHAQRRLLQEPLTLELKEGQVVAAPRLLREFHLASVTVSQVQMLSHCLAFQVKSTAKVHGFAIWFDVDFGQGAGLKVTQGVGGALPGDGRLEAMAAPVSDPGSGDWRVISPSVLSTSPASPVTHWKQTVLLLPRALSVEPSDSLCCQVALTQNGDNKRHYNIELELVDGEASDEEEDDEEEDEDDEDHCIPCDCGRGKCLLIKTLMEKYGEEQDALQAEAEIVDLTAEVQAAEAIDADMDEDQDMNVSGNS